jgi:hypothetical protein
MTIDNTRHDDLQVLVPGSLAKVSIVLIKNCESFCSHTAAMRDILFLFVFHVPNMIVNPSKSFKYRLISAGLYRDMFRYRRIVFQADVSDESHGKDRLPGM